MWPPGAPTSGTGLGGWRHGWCGPMPKYACRFAKGQVNDRFQVVYPLLNPEGLQTCSAHYYSWQH